MDRSLLCHIVCIYLLVYILTDDQDIKLNSLDVQPKVKSMLIDEGLFFENAFVTTPVCCPSRYCYMFKTNLGGCVTTF